MSGGRREVQVLVGPPVSDQRGAHCDYADHQAHHDGESGAGNSECHGSIVGGSQLGLQHG